MNCKLPLVSVVVITYNSSKYVIETLDSIYNQTYEQLELIISDDCSKDDTIPKCEEWLAKNQERFYNAQIITTSINTGIPANCNRGFEKAQGEWIKYIAGDDCLYPYAIEKYIKYAQREIEYSLFHSLVDCYINTFDDKSKVSNQPNHKIEHLKRQLNSNELFKLLSIENFIYAPTLFIKKDVFIKYGPFDETIRLCEDYPFLLKLTRCGVSLYFINEVLVKYRLLTNSATQRKIDQIFNYSKQDVVIKRKYVYPYVSLLNKILMYSEYLVKNILHEILNVNNKKCVNIIICKFLLFPYAKYKQAMTKKILYNNKTIDNYK